MKFVKQFENIIQDQILKSRINFLLEQGKKDPFFINYFGVNFDQNNVISVKLYFSFFKKLPFEFLKKLSFTQEDCDVIDKCWVPSSQYEYMHQGLTIGLKCYLKNDELSINYYFHFRSPKLKRQTPELIDLKEKDQQNIPGICLEMHGQKRELKHYHYITSDPNKKEILKKFNLPLSENKKINLIEYTESNIESKVNLIYDKSEDIYNYFERLNNPHISELNKYFFEKYQLYFYGPGIRFNSDVRAIYYVSKETFYGLYQEQTIPKLLSF